MGIGRALITLEATLLLHAIGAPVAAALAAWGFQRLGGGVAPVTVATVFVTTALVLDAVLVAPVLEGNFEMFHSLAGLWLPMLLMLLCLLLMLLCLLLILLILPNLLQAVRLEELYHHLQSSSHLLHI